MITDEEDTFKGEFKDRCPRELRRVRIVRCLPEVDADSGPLPRRKESLRGKVILSGVIGKYSPDLLVGLPIGVIDGPPLGPAEGDAVLRDSRMPCSPRRSSSYLT